MPPIVVLVCFILMLSTGMIVRYVHRYKSRKICAKRRFSLILCDLIRFLQQTGHDSNNSVSTVPHSLLGKHTGTNTSPHVTISSYVIHFASCPNFFRRSTRRKKFPLLMPFVAFVPSSEKSEYKYLAVCFNRGSFYWILSTS